MVVNVLIAANQGTIFLGTISNMVDVEYIDILAHANPHTVARRFQIAAEIPSHTALIQQSEPQEKIH